MNTYGIFVIFGILWACFWIVIVLFVVTLLYRITIAVEKMAQEQKKDRS